MNTHFFVNCTTQEAPPETAAERGDWFNVPGDLDDFIFWDEPGGPSEK